MGAKGMTQGEAMEVDNMQRIGGSGLMGRKQSPHLWGGERNPFTYVLMREAVRYAQGLGLKDEFIPDLQTINGVLHAIHPRGRMVRLKYSLDWETQHEYNALLDEMADLMAFNPP
jgi:hypothetical protein